MIAKTGSSNLDAAQSIVNQMDNFARLSHCAKKMAWLEDNPLPADRSRFHYPPWFHKFARVKAEQVICMKCNGTPAQLASPYKPAWSVRHISEVTITLRSPPPSDHEQFFICPNCSSTHVHDDEIYIPGLCPMWVISEQKYYQPHSTFVDGRMINSNWIKYIATPPVMPCIGPVPLQSSNIGSTDSDSDCTPNSDAKQPHSPIFPRTDSEMKMYLPHSSLPPNDDTALPAASKYTASLPYNTWMS